MASALGCSASIAGKLGMRRVFSVRYKDLLGADGQPLFQPAEPHVEVSDPDGLRIQKGKIMKNTNYYKSPN